MDPPRIGPGTQLAGRYTIEWELGRGGMASVYLASDSKHGRSVAVKVLDPALAQAIGSERFLQEIRISARLTHPNILPLHDSGELEGLLYYVMPYIEGESLRARLDRERHLGLDDTVRIVGQVAAALAHAHQQGIIHRDIKPENILLTGDQAVLADFGIARAIDAAGAERLTATGLAVGTPAYMSPEQGTADRVLDVRTDVYSLGCVAYEMLGGSPPFTGASAQAVMARHAIDPPPRLRTIRPAVPEVMEHVVERALAKVPADRFSTAQEFAAAFAEAGRPQAIAASARRGRSVRSRLVTAIALGVAMLGAGSWWLLRAGQRPEIRRFAVLPFDNPEVDEAQQHLVDGIHEALISDLAGEGLGVIARTSVLQYRHSEKPARLIARELGVDALVETSLARTVDSVTIRARLVDGATEQYLWSHSYQVPLTQVAGLARRVSLGIAHAVQPTLAEASTPAGTAVDPEVYDLYLQGMSYVHRPTPTDLQTSREYFERAIARDSGYAPAWAGLSAMWSIGRQRGYFTSAEATPPSEAAAYRALELDSTLAEAHFSLAEAKVYGEWDWEGGDREFRRAIELRPAYAEARAFYAHLLCILHRPKEAVEQLNRARAMDPFDPLLAWIEGATLSLLGRFDDAIALYREALKRSPNNPGALSLLWQTLQAAGRQDEAFRVVTQWAAARGDSVLGRELTGNYQRVGRAGALRAAADYLAARADSTTDQWDLAIWYAWAGAKEQALDWLERAYEAHSTTMPYLGVHPAFSGLHDEPRFQGLMRRMKLPA
jgi:eukaryotic-like serine/threonine-protein kinase